MNNLANTYYFKALDAFSYSHSEFMEAINYALSYDNNSADTHCLIGRYYMEELQQYSTARVHFEMALTNDVDHIRTYYHFIQWSIDTRNYQLAKDLLHYAKGILGIAIESLLHFESLMYEQQGKFKKAARRITEAMDKTIFTSDFNFYQDELKRVNTKISAHKKKGK